VYFVEQISRSACVDADGAVAEFEQCVNRRWFKQIIEQFGLAGAAALIYENGEQTCGLSYSEIGDIAADCDLLINISGHLSLEPLLRRLRRKAYIDIDPGFTQVWHNQDDTDYRVDGHDFYFTIGENIGKPGCIIPTGDIHWRHTRPPVVLEYWPVVAGDAKDWFTTIASWRGPFGSIIFEGKKFGLKLHEFRKFITLPLHAPGVFELALNIHAAEVNDLALLRENRWQLIDPALVAYDPFAFRNYVQNSGAEFSVAQGVYVDTESGWFSDRTVGYLASGKPVLVQDTGFSQHYPVGEGLLAFRTLDEAIAGAERIVGDYDRHSRAARALAEQYFDSDKVLGRLMEEISSAP
jgi:hypothetical protein